MFLKRRLAAFAPVVAALAIGAPVASAGAPTATDPVITGPSCPDGYAGPTNLATGCPYWMMTYSVQYPGRPPLRCPVNWSAPVTSHGMVAAKARGGGSAGRGARGCDAVATAK